MNALYWILYLLGFFCFCAGTLRGLKPNPHGQTAIGLIALGLAIVVLVKVISLAPTP